MTAHEGAVDAYGVSAGLDIISGVFGYLSSLNSASIANSEADMIRTEAEANAQRYSEQAAQSVAQEKVMYLSSGVTLAGSPIAALATSARVANENIAAIKASGAREAANAEMGGVNAEMQGRNAIVSGLDRAVGMGIGGYMAGHPGGADNAALGVLAQSFAGGGRP